ncbi:MFS transporter [Nocardia terpenica]|uniref:MFS transporter permease n=1 Tax=Nocardia terpenica TaxID=455432 RepID=A0A161Z147_9NOCA|nr:MFS transporter [Nocardia terpenica]KZM71904.1 MFS transporter permease [Nocardia terpenica]NQE86532.1 MFS transporter [Nocardia terpenica]
MNSSALDNEPEPTPEPSARTPLDVSSKIALAVVLTGELMSILDDSVVLTALPTLQQSLGTGPAGLQWLTAGYALTFALGLITGGRLGDIYGRRKTFLLGTVGFTLASLLCGIAADPGMLIAARVLQGGAAAVMIPQVLATLHVTFDGENRSRAFGLYGAVLPMANVLGPILGGLLTEADLFGLSWRPIFLINVPIGLTVIILGRKFITESTAAKADRLDLAGMLLSAIAMVLIVFPLTEGHAHGWPLWCWAMVAGGLLVLGVFLRHQQRRTDDAPLVVLSLFNGRQFAGGLSAQLMLGLLCGLFFMTWTLYLQRGLGMSPVTAGLAFVLLALGELAGAITTTKTAGRFARRLPQTGALITLAAITAYGIQISSARADSTLLTMTAPVLLLGFGLGMIGGPIADLTLAKVPHEHAGSASGLFNTALQLGYALGIALTGLVFFSATGDSPTSTLNRAAFTGVLWWVAAALTVMWALMFCLPRRADG